MLWWMLVVDVGGAVQQGHSRWDTSSQAVVSDQHHRKDCLYHIRSFGFFPHPDPATLPVIAIFKNVFGISVCSSLPTWGSTLNDTLFRSPTCRKSFFFFLKVEAKVSPPLLFARKLTFSQTLALKIYSCWTTSCPSCCRAFFQQLCFFLQSYTCVNIS